MKDGNKYIESISFGSQILERLGNIEETQKDGFAKVNDHLKELNSKTAKNSGWIERYDIRVAEEVPKHIKETKEELEDITKETQEEFSKINVKLAKWSGIVIATTTIVGFLIKNYVK